MARIKYFDQEAGTWKYADAASTISGSGNAASGEELKVAWKNGVYIYIGFGTESDSASYCATEYIDVSAVQSVKIRVKVLGANACVALYNSAKRYLSSYVPESETLHTVDVSGAHYLRVSCMTEYLSDAVIEPVASSEIVERALGTWCDVLGGRMGSLLDKATAKKICCIVDDDTTSIAAVQRLQTACDEAGIKATMACLTINLERHTGLADTLLAMEQDGFQVVLHAHTQTGWEDETDFWRDPDTYPAACEADMVQGLQIMQKTGFTNFRFWVTPYCKDGQIVQRMARKWGMECLLAGGNTYEPANDTYGRYAIRRAAFGPNDADSSISMAQLQAIAQEAAQDNGWLVIMTHFEKWEGSENTSGTETISPAWTEGKYVDYDNKGVEMESNIYAVTDFIDVSRYHTVKVNTRLAGRAGVCFYDAARNFLAGHQPSGLTEIPTADAAYMRVSCWYENFPLNDVVIEGAKKTVGAYDRFTGLIDYLKGLGYEFMTVGEAWSYRKAIYDVYDAL